MRREMQWQLLFPALCWQPNCCQGQRSARNWNKAWEMQDSSLKLLFIWCILLEEVINSFLQQILLNLSKQCPVCTCSRYKQEASLHTPNSNSKTQEPEHSGVHRTSKQHKALMIKALQVLTPRMLQEVGGIYCHVSETINIIMTNTSGSRAETPLLEGIQLCGLLHFICYARNRLLWTEPTQEICPQWASQASSLGLLNRS